MSLRARLLHDSLDANRNRAREIYLRFGLARNPFPPAGEPSGHPHMPTPAEERINEAIVVFHRDRTSQALLVEGTQGVGKTNLLSFFQAELQDAYRDDKAFYIIRYYPDPEESFEGIIRRLFQEFAASQMLVKLGRELAAKSPEEREKIIDIAAGHEVRLVLHALARAAQEGADPLNECSTLVLEWLVGLRLMKRHKEVLHVQFRLDTVESKTQALRDMVFCSSELQLLKGIFLLLDELEKQDFAISKVMVLRYLNSIRALIDALPRHLFLLVALTKVARDRYFRMLPAFGGRLQNRVTLEPLRDDAEAFALAQFYVAQSRMLAAEEFKNDDATPGDNDILPQEKISEKFRELYDTSAEMGLEGVSQRDFLNALHEVAERSLSAV